MDVRLPDGTIIQGVPDGTSKAELAGKLKKNGMAVPDAWLKGTPESPQAGAEPTAMERLLPRGVTGPTPVGEAALAMGSGMLAKPISDIAGLAATGKELISPTPGGGDPAGFKRHVQESLTYTPRSEAGKAMAEYNPLTLIGKGLGYLSDQAKRGVEVMPMPKWAEPARSAIAGGVGEAIEQAPALAGVKGGKMAAERLPGRQAALDAEKGSAAVRDATRAKAQESGYITPPEHGLKAAAAGLSGKAKVEKIISQKNAEHATREFGKEIGVPEGAPLSKEEIGARKREQYAVYDTMKEAAGPELHSTPGFKQVLQTALDGVNEKLAFDRETYREIIPAQRLLQSYLKKDALPTDGALKAISDLRKQAKVDFKNDKPDLGTARLGIAHQLENLFEENITTPRQWKGGTVTGKPELVERFREARRQLAKIGFVERVTNEATGQVDLAKVASLSDSKAYKGVLTGRLKDAADFARTYRKAAQKPTGEAAPRLTVWDGLFGLGALHFGTPWGAAAASELAMRLGVPALAERGMLQNRTPSYQASSLLPEALPLAGIAASQVRPPPQ